MQLCVEPVQQPDDVRLSKISGLGFQIDIWTDAPRSELIHGINYDGLVFVDADKSTHVRWIEFLAKPKAWRGRYPDQIPVPRALGRLFLSDTVNQTASSTEPVKLLKCKGVSQFVAQLEDRSPESYLRLSDQVFVGAYDGEVVSIILNFDWQTQP